MGLENKLYLLLQIILFSKITIQDNVDAMSSGCIPILLLSRTVILLLIPHLSESLVQKQFHLLQLLINSIFQECETPSSLGFLVAAMLPSPNPFPRYPNEVSPFPW